MKADKINALLKSTQKHFRSQAEYTDYLHQLMQEKLLHLYSEKDENSELHEHAADLAILSAMYALHESADESVFNSRYTEVERQFGRFKAKTPLAKPTINLDALDEDDGIELIRL